MTDSDGIAIGGMTVAHRVIGRHFSGQGGQKSACHQYGKLGSSAYRITIHHDAGYEHQGYAHLSMWGVGGWNQLVYRFGQQVDATVERKYADSLSDEHVDALVDELLIEAARLLYGGR